MKRKTRFLILLSVTLVGIILWMVIIFPISDTQQIIKSLIQPSFTIYKEECRINLSQFNLRYACFNGCRYGLLLENEILNINKNTDCHNKCVLRYPQQKICEQVEVSEILDEKFHYWFTPKEGAYSKNSFKYQKESCESPKLQKRYGFQGLWIDKGDYFACLKKISKQDLSIDWLDENENCQKELLQIKNFTKGVWDCEKNSIRTSNKTSYHWKCFGDWKTGDIVYLKTDYNLYIEGYFLNSFIFSINDIPEKFKVYSNRYKCNEYTIEMSK